MGSSSVCGNEDPEVNVTVATMASSAQDQGWQRILWLASSRLMVGGLDDASHIQWSFSPLSHDGIASRKLRSLLLSSVSTDLIAAFP